MSGRRQEDPGSTTARALAERLRLLGYATHGSEAAMAARLDIGRSDLQALERLMLDGPHGPAELGTALGMRPASVTSLLDRLERSGHVRRQAHPSDRRRLLVFPTEQAEEDGWKAVMPLVGLLEAAADGLDEEERRTVAAYLDRVIDALRTYSKDPGHGD